MVECYVFYKCSFDINSTADLIDPCSLTGHVLRYSYCECFAAGLYCVEPCSCQDCFNKPIHESTVLETRRNIESRNPLAFAPKVIRSADFVPEFGVRNHLLDLILPYIRFKRHHSHSAQTPSIY